MRPGSISPRRRCPATRISAIGSATTRGLLLRPRAASDCPTGTSRANRVGQAHCGQLSGATNGSAYHPAEPAPPLNGPTIRLVIQPP